MKISRHSVVYNASVLSVSGIILQLIGFVYRVYLSRMAGPEGLGVYRLVFPIYSIVIAASLSGVRLAVTSISAGLQSDPNPLRIHSLAKNSCFVFVGLFLVFATPIGLFNQFISNQVIFEPRVAPALVVMLFCIFLSGFEGIFESLFLGIGKTKYTAISNLLEQIVQMFFVLSLLYLYKSEGDHGKTATLILFGMTLSEIPVLIWLFSVYAKEMRKRPHGISKPQPSMSGRILKIAVPISVTSVATNILSSASTVILPGRLMASGMTNQEAISSIGIISGMAMPLIMLPIVLISSTAQVLLPVISRSASAQNQEDIKRKIKKSFQVTGLIALPATAIIVPVAVPLCRLLYNQTLPFVYIFLLAVSAVLIYYQIISVSIINGLGLEKKGMVNVITGEGIQLIITYFLTSVPHLNIYGYIIGMIVSPLIVTALNIAVIKRHTNVLPRFSDSVAIPVMAALVTGFFSRLFYQQFSVLTGNEIAAICISILLGILVCACILVLTGMKPFRYYQTLIPKSEKITSKF